MEDELNEALRKVAVGFSLEEVTEEYGIEDGADKLLKRKVTKKSVPPDLRAVKMLLEGNGDLSLLSDRELEEEQKRLLKELEKVK